MRLNIGFTASYLSGYNDTEHTALCRNMDKDLTVNCTKNSAAVIATKAVVRNVQPIIMGPNFVVILGF